MDQPATPDRETTDSRFEGVAPPHSESQVPATAVGSVINARRAQLENTELLRQLRSL